MHPVDTSSVEIPPYLPDTPEVRLDWATYLDHIEQADLETQDLINDLERRGKLENTIIIWIGDNGRYQIRGKGYLYEDGIRCPLIIWGKGIPKGKVIDDLVANVELTATQLAMAGVKKTAQSRGRRSSLIRTTSPTSMSLPPVTDGTNLLTVAAR